MKIGILTFHSQLNYGGVLQCWALQTALEKLGHEVVVIDRWLDRENKTLNRGYGPLTFWTKIKHFIRLLFALGDSSWHQRVIRTEDFLQKHIKRTSQHFYQLDDISEFPDDFPGFQLDALVVGSDQVWHCGDFCDPRPYLLESGNSDILKKFGDHCRLISYAASFGMHDLPEKLGVNQDSSLANIEAKPVYQRGLARFDAISCREKEGVEICRKLGFPATHVVDPTQLLTVTNWAPLVKPTYRRQLTCYFLSESVDAAMPQLQAFAARMRCRVKVLAIDYPHSWWWLSTPTSPYRAYRWLRGWEYRLKYWRVRRCEGAGPLEFLQAHAECEWVVTDSFHSLMFATTFGKNVRVLRPKDDFRRQMFARMEEYAAHANGALIVDDLALALKSFEHGETVGIDAEWLASKRTSSLDFLKRNI